MIVIVLSTQNKNLIIVQCSIGKNDLGPQMFLLNCVSKLYRPNGDISLYYIRVKKNKINYEYYCAI